MYNGLFIEGFMYVLFCFCILMDSSDKNKLILYILNVIWTSGNDNLNNLFQGKRKIKLQKIKHPKLLQSRNCSESYSKYTVGIGIIVDCFSVKWMIGTGRINPCAV